jgi:nitrogen-specific signal transduction histidine kinase
MARPVVAYKNHKDINGYWLLILPDRGNGLGLTVTKKVLEEHQGAISVKSDEDGTAFTVWLPVGQKPLERSIGK